MARLGRLLCHAPRVDAYRYSSLTSALDDASSPLRAYLWGRFPNRREIQEAYRVDAGPMRVQRSDANLGTLGTAFDQAVAYAVNPGHYPTTAGWVAQDPQTRDVIDQLRASARVVARNRQLTAEAARALWALALCIEVYRMGAPHPGSAIDAALFDDDFTVDRLLSMATDKAVEDMQALHAVALEALYPHLPKARGDVDVHTEVTFAASSLCRADADLVLGGLLLEVKTRLGRKTPAGRADTLQAIDLYQALGYLLFDLDDRYRVRQLGWY
jgi:hypothetical protein